jgi:radical SAM-linked protein
LTLCAFSREASAAQGCCLGILRALRPHAYVSLLLPLSVGVSSLCEILDFEMEEGAPALPPELPALLNRTMPEGIRVTKFYQSERKPGALAFLRARVTMEYDNGVPDGAKDAICQLLQAKELLISKRTKSGVDAEQNIIPMLRSCTVSDAEHNELQLDCIVCAQNPSLNPLQLPKAVEKYLPQYAPDFSSACRLAFLGCGNESLRIKVTFE